MAYYADGTFLLLAIAAFVYLYVTCEDLRYKFLLPIFLMLIITVNPILYKFIFIKIVYWRLFWMLPTTVLIAAAVVMLLKRQTKVWMKWGILAVAAAFIISQGQYMFSYGVFFPRSNWEKLSQETIDVCDIMLELDESPRALVHSRIYNEVRQYNAEIELMYGRETEGYIRENYEPESWVYWNLKQFDGNYEYSLMMSQQLGYNFFVVAIEVPIENETLLKKYGYNEIGRTTNHIVYYNSNIK